MRIPLSERFKPSLVILFSSGLFLLQLLEGTDIVFAVLVLVFIGLWTVAFNVSGGLDYTSGAFIFFNGLFTVVLGLVYKAILFQPGERNLRSPRLTMVVYCMTMAGIAVAAFLNRGLRTKESFFKDIKSLQTMKDASIVCLVLTCVFAVASGSDLTPSGSVVSAVRQLNRFPIITIILATTYEIRRSGGKRSINWIVICGMLVDTAFGVIYFTKEGMLLGPTCWFLTAILNRFDFSKLQLIVSAVLLSLFSYYLVPYSQYVRIYATHTRTENLAIALRYLRDLNETRRLYAETISVYDVIDEPHLYDKREGIFDRMVIFAPDDALINYAGQGHTFGLGLLYESYFNLIPRFLWRDKPIANGSDYGRVLEMVAEDDVTTGVSFSPASDAFAQAHWLGPLLIIPIEMFLAFIVADSLAGSARRSVWPILWIIEMSHLASEGGLAGTVYMTGYGILAMAALVWIAKYATPFIMNTIRRQKTSPVAALPASSLR